MRLRNLFSAICPNGYTCFFPGLRQQLYACRWCYIVSVAWPQLSARMGFTIFKFTLLLPISNILSSLNICLRSFGSSMSLPLDLPIVTALFSKIPCGFRCSFFPLACPHFFHKFVCNAETTSITTHSLMHNLHPRTPKLNAGRHVNKTQNFRR